MGQWMHPGGRDALGEHGVFADDFGRELVLDAVPVA
jgi:hypothetical protein